jgi:hypothetical protein
MPAKIRYSTKFLLALALPALAAEHPSATAGGAAALVIDRGLPQANLNASAGAIRSNIRWSWYEHGFIGDEFAIGAPGERWVIDAIRTWAVPGTTETDPGHLGDFYQDVRLYFGSPTDNLTPISSGLLAPAADETSNPSIAISDATAGGAIPYENFGANLRIWQIDFRRLNLAVEGGVSYRFGVWGMGRAIPGANGKTYAWFNHGSNAPLSQARQDGANGALLMFDAAGKYEGSFSSDGAGWNKPADINVQVFAHRVDAKSVVAQ